jgi:acetaldehyde dehydrogenase/alcohol dehydrogenase
VGLFLPYTIEFTANGGGTRYADIARFLGWEVGSEAEGAARLAEAVRDLARRINQPESVKDVGIPREGFEAALQNMIEDGENETETSARIQDRDELARLFHYAYEGKNIDF